MNRWIAAITGLHVLMHGVFGCCDHVWAAPAAGDLHCHCHHAADDNHAEQMHGWDADGCDEAQTEPHACIHASCHWVSGDVASALSLTEFLAGALLAVLPSSSISAADAAELWPDIGDAENPAPPVRLHLLVGVMLV